MYKLHVIKYTAELAHTTVLFLTLIPGKALDDDDNTKTEAAKMQKEYEALKDSTKDVQTAAEISQYSTVFMYHLIFNTNIYLSSF